MILNFYNRIFFFLSFFSIFLMNSCSKEDSIAFNAQEIINSGEGLRIGVASTDISPDNLEGILLGGYEPRFSNGMHDPLTARCLTIIDDKTIVAIIALDLIGMYENHIEEMKQAIVTNTGLAKENIFIHSIHTHSGPEMLANGNRNSSYRSKIYNGVSNAVLEALKSNTNAIAIFNSGHSSVASINRRYPEQVVANEFSTIEFQDEDHMTIATLLNFSCHPVVLGPDNLKLSADYVYYLREQIEHEKGGIAIFFNGSLGDINPPPIQEPWIYGREGGTFGMAEEFGKEIANDMLYSVEKCDTAEIELELISKSCSISIPNMETIYADIYLLNLGATQIAMLPGEPLTGLGESIKALFPGPYTMAFGLTNDYIGYLVPENEWETCSYSFLNTGCYEETKCFDMTVAGILEQGFKEISDDL